jgi:hypothetical protein
MVSHGSLSVFTALRTKDAQMAQMPYSAVRWTISGTAFGGTEIWTTGFWTGNDASDLAGDSVPQATVNAVAAAWTTFFQHSDTVIHNAYKTEFVKAAYWHNDITDFKDKTFGTPTYHTYTTQPTGSATGEPFPPQCSLVGSFKSGYRNGTAANGRMYLPGIKNGISATTGQMTTTDANRICTKFKDFCNSVNTATVPGSAGKLILVGRSVNGAEEPHNKRNAYVTNVRIGTVYDTQRRRRNALREAYSSQGLA